MKLFNKNLILALTLQLLLLHLGILVVSPPNFSIILNNGLNNLTSSQTDQVKGLENESGSNIIFSQDVKQQTLVPNLDSLVSSNPDSASGLSSFNKKTSLLDTDKDEKSETNTNKKNA
jgi:hypothetical protein